MDLQRTLLIGAIAALSFMLLTEWVAFKDEKTSSVVQESSRLIADDDRPALSSLADAGDDALDNDELPAPPTATGQPDVVADVTVVDTSKLVRVRTDVLQFVIDLDGGDIVELALPEYLETLGKDDPFVLLEQNDQLVYVARSGLLGPNGIDGQGRAQFTTTSTTFSLDEGADTLTIDLAWTQSDEVQITKRFTLRRGDYLIDIEYLVDNRSEERWQANLFGQIKRQDGLPPAQDTAAMGMQPFLGVAITQPDDRFTKFTFDDLAEESFRAQLQGSWIAMIQHYFLSAWIPNPDQTHNYSARKTNSGFNIAEFTSPALVVDPGRSGTTSAQFYAGPKDQYRLKEISPYLDLSVDYGWLWWIAQPLFYVLTFIQSIVVNWGVAIILLTVLIKLIFYPLSAASYRSMANMRRVQPKMVEIREQYADDKQKQSQAMMDLYKKEKINPMGGCLPILVQMPVFIGLYWMLMESVELRHAPFALWIKDLSVLDPYFVLPLIMGASMWFMQKLNPPPPDPMQAKIMQWMPVMFTFFFLWFPSGLVLYWVVNNLLSMAQQWYITRQIDKAAAAA
ncbi:MAG: membrane protein insertase YidC [Gammaproteobacteria bacterium]|nr:membrane protein insertase YidC [Gammaproteobacteria bacterium]